MGESRNMNSYNRGYILEFQWQRGVLSESRMMSGMGDIEYFVLVLQATMVDFYKTAGMPWVIGAVDGSLIHIKTPHDQEHLYVCHKSFHAINTIAVCGAQLSFTNCVNKKKM